MKSLLTFFVICFAFLPVLQAQESNDGELKLYDGLISEVNIYPIPATKFFIVDSPSAYVGGKIVVSDIVGKQVKIVLIEDNPKIKIVTDEIPGGIYFVSIEYNQEKIFTKRIVIDK